MRTWKDERTTETRTQHVVLFVPFPFDTPSLRPPTLLPCDPSSLQLPFRRDRPRRDASPNRTPARRVRVHVRNRQRRSPALRVHAAAALRTHLERLHGSIHVGRASDLQEGLHGSRLARVHGAKTRGSRAKRDDFASCSSFSVPLPIDTSRPKISI